MTIQLTPTQQAILTHAHQHTEGKIAWFPENIKGGARQKVIDGLFKRTLITYDGKDWFVAAEGYEALGVPRKAPVSAQGHRRGHRVARQCETTDPRQQQAGAGDRDAQASRGRHDRTDLRGHSVASPHGQGHVCRRLQEEARPGDHLDEGGWWTADLPRRLTRSQAMKTMTITIDRKASDHHV
jgi:hypothetical protein